MTISNLDWKRIGTGPDIVHRLPLTKEQRKLGITKRGERRMPTSRHEPVDNSRYPGDVLREIRASAHNFLGEIRRV